VLPFVLGSNQVHRFYLGGAAISEFRGTESTDDHAPEDWVGSATSVFGSDRDGLSILPDGRTLKEAFASEPEALLGVRHVDRFGADPGLLVKLLDAGERLPIHCHPGRDFSRRHLDCPWGKTEAWVIVSVRSAEPVVHLGFRHDVDRPALDRWVAGQEFAAMLAAMHRIPVAPGDAVLVPAGVPHAIGEGVFLVELQEPTDLSVLLEWEGFDIDGPSEGHMGLGIDVALGCVDRTGWGEEGLARLRGTPCNGAELRPGVWTALPPESDPFFRSEIIRPEDTPASSSPLPAQFSILVVTHGRGRLEHAAGIISLERGATVLVPFAAGDCIVAGPLEVVRCMPPDPDSPDVPAPVIR
jgi:mannose-6-phosphate isomerase